MLCIMRSWQHKAKDRICLLWCDSQKAQHYWQTQQEEPLRYYSVYYITFRKKAKVLVYLSPGN